MMNKILFFIILSIFSINIHSIHDLNVLREEAQDAFKAEDYDKAIKNYRQILDTVSSEGCQLNLAHAYWLTKDTAKALDTYQQEYEYHIKKSIALSQVGVISFAKTGIQQMRPLQEEEKEKVRVALSYFKNALKQNPKNEKARYNYEVLKYLLEQKDPEDNKNNQNQENKDNQNQENKDNQDQQNSDNKDNKDQKNQKDSDSENKDGEGKNQKDKQDSDNKDGEGKNQKDQKNSENKDGEGKDQKNQKDSDNKDGERKDQKDQKDSENKDGEGKDQKNQKDSDNKDGEGKNQKDKQEEQGKDPQDKNGQGNELSKDEKDKAEQEQIIQKRLEAQNMTKEQAMKLLQSATQQETKYLQQQKKRSKSSGGRNKPDW